jgi:hypothetical protein
MGENEKHYQYLFIYKGKIRMFEKYMGERLNVGVEETFFHYGIHFLEVYQIFISPSPYPLTLIHSLSLLQIFYLLLY